MGDKYIIELEDKPFHKEDGDFLYRVKGFNSLVFDMTGICKLTPYTEPDLEQVKKKAYDEGYQSGREDLNIVMSDVEQAKADAYLKGLNDGQGVILESTQNNAFNNGYKKCLEDMEQVRKEGYEDGYKTAKVQCNIQAEKDMREVGKKHYQKGLDDLWEAMQKAIKMYCEIDNEVFLRVFHDVKCDWGESVLQALFKNTPQHVIDSIREYEESKEKHTWICSEVNEPSVDTTLICSKCGYTITIKPGDTQALNFCPKCGDNKRGERDE